MWAIIAIRINHFDEKVAHVARIFDDNEYDEACEKCEALNSDAVFKYFLKKIKTNKDYDEEDWWS